MDRNTNIMSSGSLRTKISLKGGYSQFSLVCPFYGMKQELPASSPLLGSDDLIAYYDLNGSYNKYCAPKKLRENLASFLPQVCGTSNLNSRSDASCSLRQLFEKPPITGKEITNLSASAMVGFKLTPGSVSENYRFFDLNEGSSYNSNQNYNSDYHEFGQNFNDPEEIKAKYRQKFKCSLDDLEDFENDKKIKKNRNDEKEKDKEKKQKKKKKDKKKRKNMESREEERDAKRVYKKEEATLPFF